MQSWERPLLGLDSDSGSEFLNENFIRFCHQRGLTFTRSRPYKNNDNAHIEQKNYTHVRKIFGWQRFHEDRIADLMNDLYCNELRIWMNLFQPCVKLIEKKRIGSRIKRVYDRPQTPFERLTALGMLDRAQLAHYQAISDATDPFELAAVIERKLVAIRKLASEQASQPERIPGPRPPETTGNQRRKHAARMTARFPGNIPRGATMPGPVTS